MRNTETRTPKPGTDDKGKGKGWYDNKGKGKGWYDNKGKGKGWTDDNISSKGWNDKGGDSSKGYGKNSGKPINGNCYNCGSFGHMSKDCRSKGKGKGISNVDYENDHYEPYEVDIGGFDVMQVCMIEAEPWTEVTNMKNKKATTDEKFKINKEQETPMGWFSTSTATCMCIAVGVHRFQTVPVAFSDWNINGQGVR